MQYKDLSLTVAGQALKAKIEAGKGELPLDITRIVTSADANGDPLTLTATEIAVKQTYAITSAAEAGERTIIKAELTNRGDPNAEPPVPPLAEGYSIARIWFFALDPDAGEIPYRFIQPAKPMPMPAFSERPRTFRPVFSIEHGNASEVKIEVLPIEYASQDEVNAGEVSNKAIAPDTLAQRLLQMRNNTQDLLDELDNALGYIETTLSGHSGSIGLSAHGLARSGVAGFSELNYSRAEKSALSGEALVLSQVMGRSAAEESGVVVGVFSAIGTSQTVILGFRPKAVIASNVSGRFFFSPGSASGGMNIDTEGLSNQFARGGITITDNGFIYVPVGNISDGVYIAFR